MKQRINRAEMLRQFEERLKAGEKSRATIEKYLRDAGQFLEDLGEGSMLTRDAVISYKQSLTERYAVASANSKLASVNGLLRSVGCEECVVKSFKVQKSAFRSSERELTREEYIRLL